MQTPAKSQWLDISARDLYGEIGHIRPEGFDRLPFGAIRLNREGTVLNYNAAEATFAQRNPSEVVGKSFFHEVAPCTRVQEFYGVFQEAAWRGQFDHSFRFTFRFPFGLREARLRLFSDGGSTRIYVLVEPQGPAKVKVDLERRAS